MIVWHKSNFETLLYGRVFHVDDITTGISKHSQTRIIHLQLFVCEKKAFIFKTVSNRFILDANLGTKNGDWEESLGSLHVLNIKNC